MVWLVTTLRPNKEKNNEKKVKNRIQIKVNVGRDSHLMFTKSTHAL